jgi:CHASE3 domain sensor protein
MSKDNQIEYLRERPAQDALDVIKLLKAENFHQNERIEQLEAENKRFKDLMLEVQSYLTAAKDGSMSRNNSENLACELLDSIENKL